MKNVTLILLGIFATSLLNAQTQINKPVFTKKIALSTGQKIIVENTLSVEASLSPGMDVNNSTTSENLLEVKNSTDKNYTISSSLTKMKVNMSVMGQTTSYDSDKKEDRDSDMGKALGDKLNKSTDIIMDINGKTSPSTKTEKKKDTEEGNPMQGVLQMLSDNGSDDVAVAGAFELIPQGMGVGDSWSDSSVAKDMKIVRTYILKSITDKEAVILLTAVMEAVNTVEMQGMSMEFNSTTKTTGEIITDIETGQVKKKTTLADINGSFQLMGQSVPISAKANSTSIYK